ncbi:MAG: hypothetical protein HY903_01870 [Deltaproteobacteria bacterium]|nr:hypothetical protein [Deltaproteobacteria bacterium]
MVDGIAAKPLDAATVHAALDRVQQLLTAADRAPQDGFVRETWAADELVQVKDPLARAVYDYVDFANYRESYHLEGGVSHGHGLRPARYSAQRIVSLEDLGRGVGELKKKLAQAPDATDPVNRDLAGIASRARAAGLGAGKSDAQLYVEIYQATEELLDKSAAKPTDEERRLRGDGRPLTRDALLLRLGSGSLAYLVAMEVLAGAQESGGERGHWLRYMAGEVADLNLRRQVFRLEPAPTDAVDDRLLLYFLVLGKRAKETALLAQIETLVAKGAASTPR